MAGSFGSSSDDEMISGINVTPLVDVVLVLLIIFMITAPVLYQSAIKVQLPKAKTGEQSEKSPLSFTLNRDGKLMWDKDEISWEALGKRLQALGPNVSQETAIISADEVTPHGIVIKLMDALRQAGLTRFALNVESGTPPSPAH
jgi:biopolymer transport protein ExbD